jgi:P-type Ca2+ transporter type 2C
VQHGKYALNASDFRDIVGVERQGGQWKKEELMPANLDAFNQLMETLKVVARADPSDKALICNGLKASGRKMAFLGKSALDLAAVESAHVSYSIESSAQIVKQHSDMGLMDDSIGSFIKSIVWGRNLYSNIQRFLQF